MDKNKPEGCSCKSQLGFYVLCIYNNLEWTKTSPRAAHAEASLASIYFEYIYIIIYNGQKQARGLLMQKPAWLLHIYSRKNLRSSAGPAHAKAKLACVCFLQIAHNGEAQGLMVQKPMWIVCILKSEDLSFMGLGCAGFM